MKRAVYLEQLTEDVVDGVEDTHATVGVIHSKSSSSGSGGHCRKCALIAVIHCTSPHLKHLTVGPTF